MPATKYRETRQTQNYYDTYYSKNYNKQYMNTSTAYEIPTAVPERRKTARPEQRQKAVTGKKINYSFVRVCAVAIVAVILCFTMIYRQTIILESNQEIKKCEKEYAALVAANQAMQSKIDMSLEMGEIEKYAREKLGMIKPEAGQVFYIDMKMEDTGSAGSVTESGMTALSGIQGTLVNAFRVLK